MYEAVALGLAAIRRDDWVVGIPEGLNTVKVRVSDVSVEHSVKLADFLRWVERKGGSPREKTDRGRIREIVGLGREAG